VSVGYDPLWIQEADYVANHVADMHLTYNDNCPKDYNPPGFRACHDPNFIISDKMITRCDSLNTGHHGYIVPTYCQTFV
jgi:hypothetical protein